MIPSTTPAKAGAYALLIGGCSGRRRKSNLQIELIERLISLADQPQSPCV